MTDNAMVGRQIVFTWGGSEILGVREKGISLNGAPINVTSDEDAGVQKLLTLSGEDKVDLTISGVSKDHRLRADWFAGNRTKVVDIEYPNGAVISGTFYLSDYSEKGPYKDAVTFDGKLSSSGPVTLTNYS